MKYLTVLIVLVITGCAAPTFEEKAVTNYKVDNVYCEGQGFKTFFDLGKYYSFTCRDGRRFIVEK